MNEARRGRAGGHGRDGAAGGVYRKLLRPGQSGPGPPEEKPGGARPGTPYWTDGWRRIPQTGQTGRTRSEGPAPADVTGYDSQRNRRRGGPSDMGRRLGRGHRSPVGWVAASRRVPIVPVRACPTLAPFRRSGHLRLSAPVLCSADFREPPQREVPVIVRPRVRARKASQ